MSALIRGKAVIVYWLDMKAAVCVAQTLINVFNTVERFPIVMPSLRCANVSVMLPPGSMLSYRTL